MTVDIEKNKQEFNDLLRSVGREGTDYLIEDLEDLGFYDAPSSHKPLHHIQHVKRQHTQFKHLTGVNLLMPDVNLRHPKATAHKHHAKQIYSLKSRKRNKAIANNLHHAPSNLKKSLRNARASKKTRLTHSTYKVNNFPQITTQHHQAFASNFFK